jgi:alginate O-acetyltransferase complex protein AlgI
MPFNSLTFLVFFAVVLVLHNLPLPWRVKKFNLLWESYLFYAAWNPPFVLLLILATVVDWFAAKGIYRARTKAARRFWLVATLGVNFGMLGFFKYSNFLLATFVQVAHAADINYRPLQLDIVLPIGISFFTFVTMSYTLDVYRGRMKPWNSFLDYAMFVTFFPHLIAGPILRAADFLPQCLQPKKPSWNEFNWGLSLFVLGLFQKIVLADYFLAPAVETVFGSTERLGLIDSWIGTMAFAGQILFDFAGYSTCAIGIAQCLGFSLPKNFRYPYAAIGFSDFWRRWHITLSAWLRDYLYIPLGGNRKGTPRTYLNLFITMLLGGLWHGAAWTFVVWGGLHGIFLAAERLVKKWFRTPAWSQKLVARLLIALGTYLLVCLAWVFFRARGFKQAIDMIASMLGFHSSGTPTILSPSTQVCVLTLTVLALTTHWIMRDRTLENVAGQSPWWVRSIALSGMLLGILLTPGQDRAFIYFQF